MERAVLVGSSEACRSSGARKVNLVESAFCGVGPAKVCGLRARHAKACVSGVTELPT